MIEAGLPGYETATNYTLFVPARTPAEIVALLNREANAVLRLPEVVDKLTSLGIVVTGGSTEAAVARARLETLRARARDFICKGLRSVPKNGDRSPRKKRVNSS